MKVRHYLIMENIMLTHAKFHLDLSSISVALLLRRNASDLGDK